MMNFGPLVAEISWRVWGTPANFNLKFAGVPQTRQLISAANGPKFTIFSTGFASWQRYGTPF